MVKNGAGNDGDILNFIKKILVSVVFNGWN